VEVEERVVEVAERVVVVVVSKVEVEQVEGVAEVAEVAELATGVGQVVVDTSVLGQHGQAERTWPWSDWTWGVRRQPRRAGA
jgi:hypothetical protein